ncbi:hypothetical protein DY023_05215 [Microbacterium bovistercoris]|uniref:DUF624 domain-containing protein n=1 Tax=Microbacterium bovistercoris TaxID=2293570 RepID=A0A371NW22_9MICO|nr:hypothetical protein [Microbacterium bovistercoris]REJ06754.1 hypothetical protein DY023_05215 [Microbacterium bovistercoris]
MSGAVTRSGATDEVGRGPLSRITLAIHRMLVLEGLLVVTTLPTALIVMLLGHDPSNVPLFVLAMLPIAPALVAGLAAMEAWRRVADLSPGRAFLFAYRRDLAATLKWAAPSTAVLALLAFNLVHLDAVAGATAIRPPLLLLAAVLVVWQGHMIVLTAGFRLRTRDAARIALAQLLPQWRCSLGILALLIVAGTVVLALSELFLLLFAWVFAGLLALLARPVVADVTARFTAVGRS